MEQRGNRSHITTEIEENQIKIIAVGDRVGKTSLLYSFVHNVTAEEFHWKLKQQKWLGVGEKSMKLDGTEYSLLTWDTFREESYLPVRKLFYQEAHCILFCFAVDKPDTLKSIERIWLPEVKAANSGALFILVGTRSDKRVGRCLHECVSGDEARSSRWKIGAEAYVECSVKSQENVTVVFEEAIRASVMKQKQAVLNNCSLNNNHSDSCKCKHASASSANSSQHSSCSIS
ncbi:unnamed protein product [Orchesella dallaii]|uniref:Uncharacterized protein n=1 Tax=Orchesella dallaii TaxID=48710 RepID=A0ABP1QJH9_9HEXA